MDKKFIKQLQGKDFVLFEGLLNEFHTNGGTEIRTAIISTDPFIIQATVKGKGGKVFQGIGDADEKNTGALVAKHKYRMAETRAIARALRWYNNIGMCSADELGGEPETPKEKPAGVGDDGEDCVECGAGIPPVVAQYSQDKFDKFLCRPCQDKERKKNGS